jgi:nitrogen-specific signal transduction histidine kinase/ActR/RegA family two-component response regulator
MKSDIVYGLVSATWPALLADEAGAIHNVNPAAVRAFGPGMSDGTGTLAGIWQPENAGTAAEFLARCAGEAAVYAPMKLLGKKGASLGYAANVCTILEDGKKYFLMQLLPEAAAGAGTPAESKGGTMEAGLAHKQKLDCALQLARTVSLDFNNALTSILGHTSLVLSKMEPKNPWRASLMEVEKSAAKAAEIANDLAAFSRQEKEAKSQASGNLNQLLQRNVEMFQGMKLDKEVSWVPQLERRLYMAKFDEAKMQQALMKIMENAVEALVGTHGRIILTTKNIELTQPTQDRNAQLAAGTYVCAEISDNGSGIEAEVLPRIFEPFFTTKRGTKHRGLGLAWVYGIVTNQGGGVAVSSQAGSGTSVRIYLPADKRMVKDTGTTTADLSGNQTILMVDDEDLLLTMGQTILSAYGYKVITVNSGQKALEVLTKGEPQIDLLITDLVMPSMSGRELVEQVRKVSPYTRVICSSGYVRPSNDDQENTSYLQKPFTSNDLLHKVKRALTVNEATLID